MSEIIPTMDHYFVIPPNAKVSFASAFQPRFSIEMGEARRCGDSYVALVTLSYRTDDIETAARHAVRDGVVCIRCGNERVAT